MTDSDTEDSGFWPDAKVDAISALVVLTAAVLMALHFISNGT